MMPSASAIIASMLRMDQRSRASGCEFGALLQSLHAFDFGDNLDVLPLRAQTPADRSHPVRVANERGEDHVHLKAHMWIGLMRLVPHYC